MNNDIKLADTQYENEIKTNFVKGNNSNFQLSQIRLKQKIMKTSHRPSLSYCNDFTDK